MERINKFKDFHMFLTCGFCMWKSLSVKNRHGINMPLVYDSWFLTGKKSEVLMEDFLRIILWIIFFILALLGIYYIINKVGF